MTNIVGDTDTDEKLDRVVRTFAEQADKISPSLRPRQRVRRERQGGFLFVQICTSFKIPIAAKD